jgi:integrase
MMQTADLAEGNNIAAEGNRGIAVLNSHNLFIFSPCLLTAWSQKELPEDSRCQVAGWVLVTTRLVSSLNRPGANVTGVTLLWRSRRLDQGMIDTNPAVGLRGYKSRGEGYHTWTETEVAQFQATHPVGTTARLAFVLALYTAQRVSDVVRMGWQHVKGDRIAVRQKKANKPLLIKMHPELVRVLASVPKGNLTFLVTERGAPFTPAGLPNWFGKRCREAGLRQCSAHGLRKLAATRLANAGASTDHIKARTGHETSKEVERYTRAADQARLDEQALELQLRAEREQNLVQPETRLDKKGA